jgi:hypothetical protein
MHLTKEKYDKWKTFNGKWSGKTKKMRISYGKDLPLLKTYPKTISADYIKQVTQLFKFQSVL